MPTLKYAGPQPVNPNDVATLPYTRSLLATGLTTTQVSDRIDANLAGQVLKSYVDTRDALNATPTFVAAGDATRLKLADREVAGGVLGLGTSGRALASRFNVASTQRWASGFWTPAAYNSAPVSASTTVTEATVYPMTVADPGYVYKILVFGVVDASTSLDGEYPLIQVRQGTSTGSVIAEGRGAADSYLYSAGLNGGDDFERVDATDIGTSLWQTQYSAGSRSRGYDAIPQGHEAEWQVTGGDSGLAYHRRINAADQYTSGNDQLITLTQGIVPAQTTLQSDDDSMTMVICRMSDDFQNMVWYGLQSDFGGHTLRWFVRNNGTLTHVGPSPGITQAPGNKWAIGAQGTLYTAYKNSAPVSSWNDTGGASVIGAATRGWGWGHKAAYRGIGGNLGQTRPASVAEVRVSDYPTLSASAGINVVPINFASQGTHTGATQLFARLSHSGPLATVTASTFYPKLVAFTVPA